jgi:apoptosis-inducing factor 3
VNPENIVVIVGGGPAGTAAATTLRESGYDGRIVLISREKHLPYDRVKCSKSFGASADSIALRKPGFYDENKIEVLLDRAVVSVDTVRKTVTLNDDTGFAYTHLILAPGAEYVVQQCSVATIR